MANIEILSCARQQLDHRWANDGQTWIADDHDRFYLLKSGRIEVVDERGVVTVGDPSCLCLLPGGPMGRRYRCIEAMDLAWLHLRFEFHTGLSPFHAYTPPTRVPLTPELKGAVETLLAHKKSSTPLAAITASESVCKLYRPFLPGDWGVLYPDRRAIERLEPALDYMERNVNSPIVLNEVALTVCLHPTYFSNLFRATFGTPPLRYHMGLRMRRSQSLLLSPRYQRVGEVALACGFDDPMHFSRVFRKHTGVSPSSYRQRRGVVHP